MSQGKYSIILVDDEPIQNEMLKDYLSERFLSEIKTFENGEDALKYMDANAAEIVILDYHLSAHQPGAKNGVEILKAIKDKYPNTVVIMISGQDKLEVAVDSMKYGAYDYVVKGETAFSRTENILNNIFELYRMKLVNGNYKRTIIMLSVIVGLVVMLTLYLQFFTTALSH